VNGSILNYDPCTRPGYDADAPAEPKAADAAGDDGHGETALGDAEKEDASGKNAEGKAAKLAKGGTAGATDTAPEPVGKKGKKGKKGKGKMSKGKCTGKGKGKGAKTDGSGAEKGDGAAAAATGKGMEEAHILKKPAAASATGKAAAKKMKKTAALDLSGEDVLELNAKPRMHEVASCRVKSFRRESEKFTCLKINEGEGWSQRCQIADSHLPKIADFPMLDLSFLIMNAVAIECMRRKAPPNRDILASIKTDVVGKLADESSLRLLFADEGVEATIVAATALADDLIADERGEATIALAEEAAPLAAAVETAPAIASIDGDDID
jgi:hypothetical protein